MYQWPHCLVTHVCVFELVHPWFRQALSAVRRQAITQTNADSLSVESIGRYFSAIWHLNQTTHLLYEEHAFEYVICQLSTILFRPKSGIILRWPDKAKLMPTCLLCHMLSRYPFIELQDDFPPDRLKSQDHDIGYWNYHIALKGRVRIRQSKSDERWNEINRLLMIPMGFYN